MTHRVQTSIHRRSRSAGFYCPACLLTIFLLLLALPVQAQDNAGIISGTVTDPTDSVVPGASVKLTQTSTGLTWSATADPTGSFTFLSVVPGQYALSVSAQ